VSGIFLIYVVPWTGSTLPYRPQLKAAHLFLNYKKTLSNVLLALVDANYRLIAVEFGAFGRKHDGSKYDEKFYVRTKTGKERNGQFVTNQLKWMQ